jgi:hypothetical protein
MFRRLKIKIQLLTLVLAAAVAAGCADRVERDHPAADCGGCHGAPPVAPLEATSASGDEKVENYPGGGGAHKVHVDFIRARFDEAGRSPSLEDLCAPCHGAGVGRNAAHNASGHIDGGSWGWDGETRSRVEVADGRGNFGPDGTYNGISAAGWGAPGGEPQQCANVACHGVTVPYNMTPGGPATYENGFPRLTEGYPRRPRLLWDYTRAEYGIDGCADSVYDPLGSSIACAGCHAFDPADPDNAPHIRIVSGTDEAVVFDSGNLKGAPLGVAANYFGTVSGVGSGGHGDVAIRPDGTIHHGRAVGDAPVGCEACHDPAAPHFPPAAENLHRLDTTVLVDEGHTTEGLCNRCHTPWPDYTHHPSLHYTHHDGTGRDVTPFSSPDFTSPILIPVDDRTLWEERVPGVFHQSAYGAANRAADFDGFVDFWGGNFGEESPIQPRPQPFVVMPLERYVGNQAETDRVFCTTCHNPHGTDHYYPPSSTIRPENDMLRVLNVLNIDELCCACHGCWE